MIDRLVPILAHHLTKGGEPTNAQLSEIQREPLYALLAVLDPHGAIRQSYLDAHVSSWEQARELERLVLARSDQDPHEEMLDDLLDTSHDAEVVAALARTGQAWDHPAIASLLESSSPHTCEAAACVMARAEPEDLLDWLDVVDDIDDTQLVIVSRAIALSNDASRDDGLIELLDAMREEDAHPDDDERDPVVDAIEAAVALSSPLEWARRVMGGEYDARWFSISSSVADFLVTYGETSWLEALALLERSGDDGAFSFASMLAVVASAGLGMEGADVRVEELHRLIEESQDARDSSWEALAVALGFRVAIAIGDDGFMSLFVQVAAHERLLAASEPSPGVMGLPLSSTDHALHDISAARSMFEEAREMDETIDSEHVVSLVKTLCDVRAWSALDDDAYSMHHLLDAIEALTTHPHPAIALAAKRCASFHLPPSPLAPSPHDLDDAIIAGIDIEGALPFYCTLAQGETVASVWAMHELTQLALEEALICLASILPQCAPFRGLYLMDVTLELLAEDEFVDVM